MCCCPNLESQQGTSTYTQGHTTPPTRFLQKMLSAERLQHKLEKLKHKRESLVLVLDLLLDEGSDPSCRQESSGPILEVGCSLLHHLARVGDHARLLWFLHRGSQVDPVDLAGTTPLLLAAAKVSCQQWTSCQTQTFAHFELLVTRGIRVLGKRTLHVMAWRATRKERGICAYMVSGIFPH